MAQIKYVARALNECVLGNTQLRIVAYFVSKAYVDEGVVIRDDAPFVVADFSSLFGKVSLGRRKGFVVENGSGIYRKFSFNTYEECNSYVEKLNNKLMDKKIAVLGNDRAVLRRHERDIEYAKRFEKIYAGKNDLNIQQTKEFGEE